MSGLIKLELKLNNKKNTWGGARRGAGRPSIFGGASVAVGVRLSRKEADRLRAMAEAEGVALGVMVVHLMDFYQQRHTIPKQ